MSVFIPTNLTLIQQPTILVSDCLNYTDSVRSNMKIMGFVMIILILYVLIKEIKK